MGDSRTAVFVVGIILIIVGLAGLTCTIRQECRRRREGYLIYPYLDLDEPGERGSYYSMAECV